MFLNIEKRLKHKAHELGFELFGIARISALPEFDHYDSWLEKNFHAEMHYLKNHQEKKKQPGLIVENAQSIIVCGKNYNTNHPRSTELSSKTRGWISRYAWGDDYHDHVKLRMKQLYEFLQNITTHSGKGRYYVDTGPVFERAWAKYAGIGWTGKNTCTLNKNIGSYFFLSVIITDMALASSAQALPHCGSCTKCIDACPTDALREPYILDSNRCISYHTIENKDTIPLLIRNQTGNLIYGCDICQDVCPWNKNAPISIEPFFQPRKNLVIPKLAELLQLTEEEFRIKFRKSPIKRTKYRGFMRNVLIAIGNSGNREFIPKLIEKRTSTDEYLKSYINWAIDKLEKEKNG